MKKFVTGLCLTLVCLSTQLQAKSKCDAKVDFDIYLNKQNVKIINNLKSFTVSREGLVSVDGVEISISPTTRQRAIQFQQNVRQTLPDIERRTYQHLNDLKSHFSRAINDQVGHNSSLLKHLDSIYKKLGLLLKSAIYTHGDTTQFHHQAFNNITDEGQKIAKKEFFGILKDSVKEFKLWKNFSTVKGIAKKEWRQKKPELKAFNEEVCETMKVLSAEQAILIKHLQSPTWLNTTPH